jgi:hypothetical protein
MEVMLDASTLIVTAEIFAIFLLQMASLATSIIRKTFLSNSILLIDFYPVSNVICFQLKSKSKTTSSPHEKL